MKCLFVYDKPELANGQSSPWVSFGWIRCPSGVPVLLANVTADTIEEAMKLPEKYADSGIFIRRVIDVPDDTPLFLPVEAGAGGFQMWLSLLPENVRARIQGEIDGSMSSIRP